MNTPEPPAEPIAMPSPTGEAPSHPHSMLAFPGATSVTGLRIGQALLEPLAPAGWTLEDTTVQPDRAPAAAEFPAVATPATWIWFLAWLAAVLALFIVLALIAIPVGA